MTTIAMYGAGHMGAALGWALREGGADVITSLAGRSERTARLAGRAGLRIVSGVTELVETAHYILVVTPPGAATIAAAALNEAVRLTGAAPVIADLNAVSPSTMDRIAEILSPLPVTDGSISGAPPTVRPGARLYFSGPHADEIAALPWRHTTPISLGPRLGSASALKMSTASVYKGLIALYAQAMRSADHYGVLEPMLADLRGSGYDLTDDVAVAATKAHRYVPEMRQISDAHRHAGLTPELFSAFAEVYADIAGRPLADGDPESAERGRTADEIAAGLR